MIKKKKKGSFALRTVKTDSRFFLVEDWGSLRGGRHANSSSSHPIIGCSTEREIKAARDEEREKAHESPEERRKKEN